MSVDMAVKVLDESIN